VQGWSIAIKQRSLLFADTERYYDWLAEEVGLAHFFSWGQ
jgi:hypothetical protein